LNSRKRRFTAALIFAMVLSAALLGTGCRFSGDVKRDDGKIRVVTTIFPPYDFVRQVAGDLVTLQMLLPLGTESHSYEPTPQDLVAIQNCDVFIYIGGESDQWVDEFLEAIDTEHMTIISMLDSVGTILEETDEGIADTGGHSHGSDEDHDHEQEEYDEHVWTDPDNAIQLTRVIAKALSAHDPAHSSLYEKNAEAYTARLAQLDDALHKIVENAARRVIVFGDRFPMRYFAEAYGLTCYAAFSGCASDTEAGAAVIASLIDRVREEQIPVVFHMELSNGKIADTICEEGGAVKRQLNSCHNLTKEQFDAGVGYVELMEENADALKEALY